MKDKCYLAIENLKETWPCVSFIAKMLPVLLARLIEASGGCEKKICPFRVILEKFLVSFYSFFSNACLFRWQ